jgi:squalene synthase HpnC
MDADPLEQAYAHCLAIVRGHYENFPVASVALPKSLRRPVSVIYAFARTADDIADEGQLTAKERLERLDILEQQLDAVQQGQGTTNPIFAALADVVKCQALPWAPFHHLLTAFRMDVTKKRYADFGEVMEYCRHSANPVGRLMLHLFDAATAKNIGYSDAVCSALQLINFLQDVGQDYDENGRIYLPMDEMQRFQVDEQQIRERRNDAAMRKLMDFQIQRARQLLLSGAHLGLAVKGREGFELRMIIAGGNRILTKLQESEDAFSRPRLKIRDWVWVLWRSLLAK